MVLGQRKVKQTFFFQMDKIIDWNPIRGIIEIAYTKGNKATSRPNYDSLALFKTGLLRTWYGLSDGEVEEQVNNRLSFSRFVRLGLEDTAPDSTTVCRFRNILVEADLYDMVLEGINNQLAQKGVIVKRGAIVNASITDIPRRPSVGRKEYEAVEDGDEETDREDSDRVMLLKEMVKSNVDGEARWGKKMGKLHFGYKQHTVTDENGLVLAEGARARKITEKERRVNVAISKIRYRVEHTFGFIHRWFRSGMARYVGLAKTHAQHIMEAVAYNLY